MVINTMTGEREGYEIQQQSISGRKTFFWQTEGKSRRGSSTGPKWKEVPKRHKKTGRRGGRVASNQLVGCLRKKRIEGSWRLRTPRNDEGKTESRWIPTSQTRKRQERSLASAAHKQSS